MGKKVYRFCEIKEEHELDLYFRVFECPQCIGGAVHHDLTEITGADYWDTCDECGGHGVLFLEDCRPCEYCGKKIYFQQVNEKWIPFNADTDTRHFCLSYQVKNNKDSR